MKINVEFDLTPGEFREAMGLPNVEAFQRDMMDRIQKQMASGVEGYDPMSIMKPFLQPPPFLKGGLQESFSDSMGQGLASLTGYQQMMMDMMRQAQMSSSTSSSSESKEDSSSKTSDSRKKTSGSATSRNKRQTE